MLIELKKIKVAEHLSEETTAFTANLYINGEKIAFVNNRGDGGNTNYQLYKQKDADILQHAEEYCKSLPPEVYPDIIRDGKPFTVSMDLERYIDDLLYAHLKKKHVEKFYKEMVRHQGDSILFDIPDQEYQLLRFSRPLAELLQIPKGIEAIKNAIQEKIIPRLKEGEAILNTNLPPELVQLERKRPPRQSPRIDDPPDKKQGPRR